MFQDTHPAEDLKDNPVNLFGKANRIHSDRVLHRNCNDQGLCLSGSMLQLDNQSILLSLMHSFRLIHYNFPLYPLGTVYMDRLCQFMQA